MGVTRDPQIHVNLKDKYLRKSKRHRPIYLDKLMSRILILIFKQTISFPYFFLSLNFSGVIEKGPSHSNVKTYKSNKDLYILVLQIIDLCLISR